MLYLFAELELQERNMNLKSLTNQALDAKVISLAKKDKELLAETIIHIAEVERRKLYRQMNIKSLYAYLTDHAGFSNGSAFRFIDAGNLQLEVPELAAKIEAGKININQVRLIQEAARQREKEDREKEATKSLELTQTSFLHQGSFLSLRTDDLQTGTLQGGGLEETELNLKAKE
jgi:hypothetical protein